MANSYKTKSVYFAENEFKLLNEAIGKSQFLNRNFSDYVKELIKQDLGKDTKLPGNIEKEMIKLIKKYAPTVNSSDIKKDIKEFDSEAIEALNQFEDM